MNANCAMVFGERRYLTYPHANGFADGGRSLVLGCLQGTRASLWKFSLDTKHSVRVGEFDVSKEKEPVLWFDVAMEANCLVTIAQGAVWRFDLDGPGNCEVLFRPGPGEEISSGLPSVTRDGAGVLIGLRRDEVYQCYRLSIPERKGSVLFEKPWWAGHFHFCPHDEEWIGFCHEGLCEEVGDRLWGWHPRLAPNGRCLFFQRWGEPSCELSIGHERWNFHAAGVSVVAYGASRGGPRGIYQNDTEGRVRLISPGQRDWHVNISRDGRWMAVDTSGPHDIPGRGWDQAEDVSDILIMDSRDGIRHCLARTRFHIRHPFHPHPCFSPDGRDIYFNEATAPGEGRVMRVANPLWRSPETSNEKNHL